MTIRYERQFTFWTALQSFFAIHFQIMTEPSRTLMGKLSDYSTTVWNQFDIIVYSLTIFGIILKNFKPTFEV